MTVEDRQPSHHRPAFAQQNGPLAATTLVTFEVLTRESEFLFASAFAHSIHGESNSVILISRKLLYASRVTVQYHRVLERVRFKLPRYRCLGDFCG